MDNAGAAGTFMKIVNILCDNSNIILVLKGSDEEMGLVGFFVLQLYAQVIVEVYQKTPVLVPAVD